MSEVKVNKITPTADCGTVTLGDSGDTVAIASGATLTSAGSITNLGTITNTGTISGGTITGTIDGQVNWQTTVKTTSFTATAGEGYFCNTTSAAFTVTLPASPSAGDIVGIKDYANTADTNNITIGRNGSNIQGTANDFVVNTEGLSIVLLYVDSTKGWLSVSQAKASDISQSPLFTVATGGTITTCGDYKIHTFTGPGTFCVSQIGNAPTVPGGGPSTVSYVVLAGGASGGMGNGNNGGGGGAGGYREGQDIAPSYTASPLAASSGLTITATGFPITVGGGGAALCGTDSVFGNDGSNSVFSTITSTGGGGGSQAGTAPRIGRDGGSGGGGGGGSQGPNPGGSGNTPPVSPPQGNNGGNISPPHSPDQASAGGGGAGAAGRGHPGSGSQSNGGPGGAGTTTSIPGTATGFAGGGGGGAAPCGCVGNNHTYPNGKAASAGTGPGATAGFGGGNGGRNSPQVRGGNAPDNKGGGGGGSAKLGSGAGGSGIVIIRYKFQ